MASDLDGQIESVAGTLLTLDLPHPVRVGIDGFCAAGKTTVADRLATILRQSRVRAIRLSTDHFQNPPEVRWKLGPDSPEGFYLHSIDVEALKKEALEPLGPGGSRHYLTSTYDIHRLRPDRSESVRAPDDAVVLLDGLFLLCDALEAHFDFTVFVDATFETCIARATARNQEMRESPDEIEEMYRRRYIPGYQLYLEERLPRRRSSVVIENNMNRKHS